MHFCSKNRMNQGSDRGACFPEDISMIEEQKKTCDCIESSVPSSSEIGDQLVVKSCENSMQECAEPIDFKVTISLPQKNGDIDGIKEVLEEDNINACQKKKRLKKTLLTELETIEEEASSSSPVLPQIVGSASLDQVDFGSTSEERVIAEAGISVEVVKKKLREEASDCCLSFQNTSSEKDDEVLNDKSNGTTSENCDSNILTVLEHRTENNIVSNVVLSETDNDILPRVASGDRCCTDSPLHLDNKELSESNDGTTIDKNSCDANKVAINLPGECHDEAKETVNDGSCLDSPLHLDNEELSESNDATAIDKNSCDANEVAINLLEECHDEAKDNVSNVEEHVVEFAEENLKHSGGLNGVASQNANESITVDLNGAFAGYTGKKLLVLDVNGLLVDINSFVPYDYDPDDIILRKAVFKRPYCDDFLKFCFEKFNVGVWSSRTKRNVEPILDFLLGNDKSKLLFCWDQSHCTDTGYGTVEKKHKPLLLKKLKKLWNKCDPDLPWERGVYNESNTLLLDDTPYKALSNPRYTAIFPYTYRYTDVRDNSIGPGGDLRVYLEGLAMAENVQEYVKQNPFGQRPIRETNLSWGYYLKVIEASSTPPRETEDDESRR
ncbi:Phosphoprotein phosphatase [Handroanthus impetiginosus]|uniref:Phosphoprotein phosphatase n=1 Tax=Handroanthus impetiginosus TaxID=429701 RepID=A0A2G9H521_9LAMI|nr:Phosphoprotein phosphatase [Handroanthus impetiginosus]